MDIVRGMGGMPLGGPAMAGGGAPGGGPGIRTGSCVKILTVPELTLVVTTSWPSGETQIMWVRFCPVPRMRSILLVAGS